MIVYSRKVFLAIDVDLRPIWILAAASACGKHCACTCLQAPEVAPAPTPVEQAAEVPAEDTTPAIASQADEVCPPPCVL